MAPSSGWISCPRAQLPTTLTAEQWTRALPKASWPHSSSHSQRRALPTLLSTDSTLTLKLHGSSSLEARGAPPTCQAALPVAQQPPGHVGRGLPAGTSSQGA